MWLHMHTADALASADRTFCLCPTGTYQQNVDDSVDGTVTCEPCVQGAECDQPGVTFATLQTRPGAW